MEFGYRLTGVGWAEARLMTAGSSVTVTASYLSDALGELLRAVGDVLEGAVEARCSWWQEPGELRWVFQRAGSDVHLRVLGFGDTPSTEPDAEGTLIFETTEPLRGVASVIGDGAKRVLNEHGEDGYVDRWINAPFPTGQLDLVRARLLLP